jgi:hypothetical protein
LAIAPVFKDRVYKELSSVLNRYVYINFLLFLGSSKGLPEQLAIDSYLAVKLMVLLIVGRRLKTSPCPGLLKVGML